MILNSNMVSTIEFDEKLSFWLRLRMTVLQFLFPGNIVKFKYRSRFDAMAFVVDGVIYTTMPGCSVYDPRWELTEEFLPFVPFYSLCAIAACCGMDMPCTKEEALKMISQYDLDGMKQNSATFVPVSMRGGAVATSMLHCYSTILSLKESRYGKA